MLRRILNPIAVRNINNIPMIDSLRYKSHSSSEVHHDEVDHHDPYRTFYERLWQQKATLDWLPKPEGNWQEFNEKKNRLILIKFLLVVLLLLLYH
jgi:hypothetical protein